MYQQVFSLLVQSYTSANNQQIRKATQALFSLAPFEGFLPTLMKISVNPQIDERTTCAALTQIKNCVRAFWDEKNTNQICLNHADKQYLQNNIIQFNIALSEHHKYSKLIKDILAMMGGCLIQKLPIVIAMLQQGIQLRTCLNFLLGVVSSVKANSSQEMKKRKQLLNTAVVKLTDFMVNGQMRLNQLHDQLKKEPTEEKVNNYKRLSDFLEEIMYLSIKFMTKIIRADIEFDAREWLTKWAQVCINRLNDTKEYYHTPEHIKDEYLWQKKSQIFVYFHGRKWAIKYLLKFIQQILIYRTKDHNISNLTNAFYQNHWSSLISVVKGLFSHYQPLKVRIIQLKLVEAMFRMKPRLMQSQLFYFQYQVLPSFILFEEQDYELAISEPTQYLAYQDEHQLQSQNLRFLAAQQWVNLTQQYGQLIQQKSSKQQALKFYSQSYHYIFELLQSNQHPHQLAGIYLLHKLSKKINLNMPGHLIKGVSETINFVIQKFLNAKDFLLQSKVLEIYYRNHSFVSPYLRKRVLSFIIHVLQAETSKGQVVELVKINAIIALKRFNSAQLSEIKENLLQKLLDVYLQMLLLYELEEIIHSFNIFMSNFRDRIKPYAVKIVHYLGQSIHSINQTAFGGKRCSIFSVQNKAGVASGALQSISILCRHITPQKCQIKEAVQQQLDLILQEFFGSEECNANNLSQISQSIFQLLKEFLTILKANNYQLSPNIRFYYVVMLLKLAKLPEYYMINGLPQLSLSTKKLKVIKNCSFRQEYLFFDFFNVLKMFLKFIKGDDQVRKMSQIRASFFQSNDLQKLFYMIFSYYQKSNQEEETLQQSLIQSECKGRVISTILLIYLIEEHSSRLKKTAYQKLFIVIKLNFAKEKSASYLLRYNKHLFYIWIWAHCKKYLSLQDSNQKRQITTYIVYLLSKEQLKTVNTTFYEEKRRILLAYCSLLQISLYIPQIKIFQTKICQILFRMMRSIMVMHGILSQAQQELQQEEETQAERAHYSHQPSNEDLETLSISQEILDQPNLVISLHHQGQREAKFDSFHFEIQQLTDPERVYDMEYVSELDKITNEIIPFLEVLMKFQNLDPTGFYQVVTNTKYQQMLRQIYMKAQENYPDISSMRTQDWENKRYQNNQSY